MPTDYLTPDEIASTLQVSRQVVYNWINDGRLRAVKAGRTLRVPRYALEAFLQPVNAGEVRDGGVEPDNFLPVDRFTPAVQAVTMGLMNEVQARQNIQAEVEHLLWALLHQDDGIVIKVLQQLGVDLQQVTQQLDQALAKLPRDPNFKYSPELPLAITPRIMNVLKRAEELANLLPDLQIDTSHILMAICEEADGESARILQSFGVTPERLRVAFSVLPAKNQSAEPRPVGPDAAHSRSAWEQRIEQQLSRIETELSAIRSMLKREGE